MYTGFFSREVKFFLHFLACVLVHGLGHSFLYSKHHIFAGRNIPFLGGGGSQCAFPWGLQLLVPIVNTLLE